MKLIQILPINDTSATHTWLDSYPYAAISAFALHPLYLNLNHLVAGKKKSLPKILEAQRKRLNALEAVDYEAVMKAKLEFVQKIFPQAKKENFRPSRLPGIFRAKPALARALRGILLSARPIRHAGFQAVAEAPHFPAEQN